MRRLLRLLGTLMIVAGLCTLAWAFAVWRWEDPFTSLYTSYQQRGLSSGLEERFASYTPAVEPAESLNPPRSRPRHGGIGRRRTTVTASGASRSRDSA